VGGARGFKKLHRGPVELAVPWVIEFLTCPRIARIHDYGHVLVGLARVTRGAWTKASFSPWFHEALAVLRALEKYGVLCPPLCLLLSDHPALLDVCFRRGDLALGIACLYYIEYDCPRSYRWLLPGSATRDYHISYALCHGSERMIDTVLCGTALRHAGYLSCLRSTEYFTRARMLLAKGYMTKTQAAEFERRWVVYHGNHMNA
jgi:hypothetical protein